MLAMEQEMKRMRVFLAGGAFALWRKCVHDATARTPRTHGDFHTLLHAPANVELASARRASADTSTDQTGDAETATACARVEKEGRRPSRPGRPEGTQKRTAMPTL
jgi:hypothetical protein